MGERVVCMYVKCALNKQTNRQSHFRSAKENVSESLSLYVFLSKFLCGIDSLMRHALGKSDKSSVNSMLYICLFRSPRHTLLRTFRLMYNPNGQMSDFLHVFFDGLNAKTEYRLIGDMVIKCWWMHLIRSRNSGHALFSM